MKSTLLRKRNRFLLTLAVLGDFFEAVQSPLKATYIPYKEVYGFTPKDYNKKNYQSTLSRALKVGNIEKIVKDGELFLRLTAKGDDRFKADFPLISFQKKSWDRKWRVLFYDIPEGKKSSREALRKKILSLGFGKLQKSIYISPFPIEKEMVEFLSSHKLSNDVLFLISDTILAGGDKYLAEQVWKLSEINEKYKNILEKINEVKDNNFEKIRGLKAEYIEVLISDPFLPKELLPGNWLKDEVKRRLKKFNISIK